MNRTALLTLTLLSLVMAALAWRSDSQQPAPNPPEEKAAGKPEGKSQPPETEDKTREINVKADRAKYNNKTGITTFTGNVTVTQVGEKFTMVSDKVDYEEETDTAKATGNMKFSDPDTTITGDLITAYFADKKALITGNVKLTSHGAEKQPATDKGKEPSEKKKDEKSEPLKEQYKKKKTVMTCDQIEYLYSEGKATATGNLKFSQEDKKGTAEKAIYLDDEQQLVLEGGAEVLNEKGEKIRCRKAIIYIDEDTIDAEGVEAVLIRKEEKKKKGKTPSTEAKPGEPATEETKPETVKESKAEPPDEE
ncbi:MAG: LPS export ABC transporter periplasmic protein LptC [Armatimonadetes bacterium]|nr:LPS export ABC transporter periplasmic protein LptC [Armatimonadota bacterium]